MSAQNFYTVSLAMANITTVFRFARLSFFMPLLFMLAACSDDELPTLTFSGQVTGADLSDNMMPLTNIPM